MKKRSHTLAIITAALIVSALCACAGDRPDTGTSTTTAETTPQTEPATEAETEAAVETKIETDIGTETDTETAAATETVTETGSETAPDEQTELVSIQVGAASLTEAGWSVSVSVAGDSIPEGAFLTVSSDAVNTPPLTISLSGSGPIDITLPEATSLLPGKQTLLISLYSGDELLDTASLCALDGVPQLTEDGVLFVLSAMTDEEKAHLVTGTQTPKLSGASGGTYAIPRLGVPSVTLMDGTAGVRYGQAVWYPSVMNLASSWDAALVSRVGQSTGRDALGKGFDIILSPGLNIQKNPLCGRNFEYFSEDPVLTGLMAAAFTDGMQSTGVGVALKHYAVNNQETSRGSVSADLTERALREIYVKAFGIAVQRATPYTIMSSYNRVNGTYSAINADLLDGILRREFGFDGMVMSDWGSEGNIVDKLMATNDINMPGSEIDPADVLAGLASGRLSTEALDASCRRILELVVKSPTFQGKAMGGGVSFTGSRKVSEEAAADTMVLLKNQNASLPLSGGTTVAVYGNGAVQTVYGGFGAASVTPAKTTSIMEGIRKSKSLSVYQYSQNPFLNCKAHSATDASLDIPVTETQAVSDAAGADVAVIVISRDSREGWDRTNTEGDFRLNATERDMIEQVSKAFHEQGKQVIVLLNTGSPMEVVSWQDSVDAILWVGYAGEQTGTAVAKVLTGEVNPSGKLTDTWPTDYTTVPDYDVFPGTSSHVTYYDDIYVGYRYYDTFGVEVAYSFGHGLSYTTFAYSDMTLSRNDDGSLTAHVTVTNTGTVSGREVVQLYVSKPETLQEQAAHELCGFAKTAELAPGASETVTIEISVEALETYDTENSRWIIDRGTYTIAAAASLADIRATCTVVYDQALTILDTENLCSPEQDIDHISKETYIVPDTQTHVNLAYGKEAWSNYSEGKDAAGVGYEASNATDGDLVTRWSGFGLSSGNHLWQVDLGETYAVGEVVIRWESLSVPFTLLVSEDGESFTEVGMYTADDALRTTLNLYGRKARFIRLNISRGSFVSIREFAAYAATDADIAAGNEIDRRVNLAQGKPTTSTACEGDYIAANAVDGSTATRWGSLPGGEAWWQVDLESVCHLTEIQVYMESSWQTYRIEYSTDGEHFTTLRTCQKDELLVLMEGVDIDARYIRLVREGETWFSIIEVMLYGT